MGIFRRWKEKRLKQQHSEIKSMTHEPPQTNSNLTTDSVEMTPFETIQPQNNTTMTSDATEGTQSEIIQSQHGKSQKPAKYHVSQNKDEISEHYKSWRVRKEGSKKTIKYFSTQKEAIDYASELAESNKGSLVIHKVDGSIRKQKY